MPEVIISAGTPVQLGNLSARSRSTAGIHFGHMALNIQCHPSVVGWRKLKSLRVYIDGDPSARSQPKPFFVKIFSADSLGNLIKDFLGDSIFVQPKWSFFKPNRWIEIDLQDRPIFLPVGWIAFGIQMAPLDVIQKMGYDKQFSSYRLYNTLAVGFTEFEEKSEYGLNSLDCDQELGCKWHGRRLYMIQLAME
ncbi:MAG TPA: hypothetical protein VFV37_08935 [Luteibaculaceae bacterium]|nr:hypothetical protein [Luteibaculaceae bacterium]